MERKLSLDVDSDSELSHFDFDSSKRRSRSVTLPGTSKEMVDNDEGPNLNAAINSIARASFGTERRHFAANRQLSDSDLILPRHDLIPRPHRITSTTSSGVRPTNLVSSHSSLNDDLLRTPRNSISPQDKSAAPILIRIVEAEEDEQILPESNEPSDEKGNRTDGRSAGNRYRRWLNRTFSVDTSSSVGNLELVPHSSVSEDGTVQSSHSSLYKDRLANQPDMLSSRHLSIGSSDDEVGVKRQRFTRRDTEESVLADDRRDWAALEGRLLIRLDELYLPYSAEGEMEWHETGRWIEYEEAVESGAERFGKPKVASLSFHSLLELRHCLEIGVILFDLTASTMEEAIERLVNQMGVTGHVQSDDQTTLHRLLLLRHSPAGRTGESSLRRNISYNSLRRFISPLTMLAVPVPMNGHIAQRLSSSLSIDGTHQEGGNISDDHLLRRSKSGVEREQSLGRLKSRMRRIGRRMSAVDRISSTDHIDLLKRLPKGAESASVLVGTTAQMHRPAIALVRLSNAVPPIDSKQIPVPVRFIFILIGPLQPKLDYHEVGRAICTLLANKRFRDITYTASHRGHLIQAINEFLDDSIVLPPGDWDREHLLNYSQLRSKSNMLRQRRQALVRLPSELGKLLAEEKAREIEDPMRRTGHLFGGLFREGRRRIRHYVSDFTDSLSLQCLLSVIFIFFTCFFPSLAFGAILSEATEGWMGVTETLLATSIGGVVFSLTSTQPLLILGVCGPMLIFEESLYMFCDVNDLPFLTVRLWVSIWALLICTFTVALEGPLLIRYLTRFSDDILAALISVIFIGQCLRFIVNMFALHPVMTLDGYCTNSSVSSSSRSPAVDDLHVYGNYTAVPQPNTALLSCMLISGTFLIAYLLKGARNSRYFGRQVRKALGDFGLSLAVIVMVLLDRFCLGDENLTGKLRLTPGIVPTLGEKRDWLVSPWLVHTWLCIVTLLPGLLLFFILFTETEVCQMLLANKQLKKGTGYHWDLMLSGILLCFCALFGVPWLCTVSVRSSAHVNSLLRYRLRAPGQKPKVIGVIEQRGTALILHLFIVAGLTLLVTPVLKTIPVPVLFGVFLYLGVMNLLGLQMLSRCILYLVPVKHHPNTVYCLRVRTWRMHLFTGVQLLCFALVWTTKSIKITAFAFPLTILVAILFRQYVIPLLFNQFELLALDSGEDDQDDEMDFYEESRIPAFVNVSGTNY